MQHNLEEQAIARGLRALADEQPPYGFTEFQRRAAARASGADSVRRLSLSALVVAGAAASLMLAIAGMTLWDRYSPSRGWPSRGWEATASEAHAAVPPSSSQSASDEAARGTDDGTGHAERDSGALAVREARVAAIERWLATLPDDPALVRVGSRVAVSGLEDRIAQLDDEISAERVVAARPERLLAIEQERAQLVSSLAQVRYAETLAAESP